MVKNTQSPVVTIVQIIKPAVADAAGQAEYAADRITREAVMPLAEAVAGQVRMGLTVSARRSVIFLCQEALGSLNSYSAQCETQFGCLMQAEPTAELVKERYVAPIAAIVKEQVHCCGLTVPLVVSCICLQSHQLFTARVSCSEQHVSSCRHRRRQRRSLRRPTSLLTSLPRMRSPLPRRLWRTSCSHVHMSWLRTSSLRCCGGLLALYRSPSTDTSLSTMRMR